MGVTVFTPEVGTSPIPSMEALVASVVCQDELNLVSGRDHAGSSCDLRGGCSRDAGWARLRGGGSCFFLQPATATRATSRTAGTSKAIKCYDSMCYSFPKFKVLPGPIRQSRDVLATIRIIVHSRPEPPPPSASMLEDFLLHGLISDGALSCSLASERSLPAPVGHVVVARVG